MHECNVRSSSGKDVGIFNTYKCWKEAVFVSILSYGALEQIAWVITHKINNKAMDYMYSKTFIVSMCSGRDDRFSLIY